MIEELDKEQEGGQDDRKYRVSHIEKIETPKGFTEGDWYSYVINHQSSKIEGKRPGTLKSVTKYAEEYAETLNERAMFGYSAYATRKTKK